MGLYLDIAKQVEAHLHGGPREESAMVLFAQLRTLGVTLVPWVDSVRLKRPHASIPAALLQQITMQQRDLVDLVEAFEERAALIEYDGGLLRAEAEALAWACVLGEASP